MNIDQRGVARPQISTAQGGCDTGAFEVGRNACQNLLLGAAADCTVFQIGAAEIDMSGASGGVIGDACIGANGKLSMSGGQFIDGLVRLAPGATLNMGDPTKVDSTESNLELNAKAALNAAENATKQACTQNVNDLKSTTTITGTGGVNVICVNKIELSGEEVITLKGGLSDTFILNVIGEFSLSSCSKILADGLPPSDVFFNVIGTGEDVKFSGGGSCSIVDGTVLAPDRKIALSLGVVNGQIISGGNISLSSSVGVGCQSLPNL
jgi:choice-of-anchor A domain-containing protein